MAIRGEVWLNFAYRWLFFIPKFHFGRSSESGHLRAARIYRPTLTMSERLREQAGYVGALEQQLRNTRAGIAGADGRPTETCPSCEKSFVNIDYFHAHMRRQHPKSMARRARETEMGDVKCALARFARRRVMSRGPSHELSADRDVMLAAVRCDATFLKYAATALRAAV